MPDIAMCRGEGCADRSECYRAMADPSGWQTWFAETRGTDKDCGYFMPLWPKKEPPDALD